jgi:hypothetical protein
MGLNMMMFVSGCFPCLCKVKLKIGLEIYQLQASEIFINSCLDGWVIMGNVFLILEEYDHLKRNPGETVQQFSTRFNDVYHSIPVDVRLPPGLAKFHFPEAFDPEMTFQLRERNIESLEEMQNIAVDVETNLLIKRSKLKDKEMDQLKSSEAKLQILASAMEKMM